MAEGRTTARNKRASIAGDIFDNYDVRVTRLHVYSKERERAWHSEILEKPAVFSLVPLH